jgi:hypothetical protein
MTVHNWAYAGLTLIGVGMLLAWLSTRLDWTWLFGEDPPGADPEFADDLHGMVEEFRDHHAEINDLVDDELNPAIRMDQAAVDAELAVIADKLAADTGIDLNWQPDRDFQAWGYELGYAVSKLEYQVAWQREHPLDRPSDAPPPPDYRVVWDGGESSFVDLTCAGRHGQRVTA